MKRCALHALRNFVPALVFLSPPFCMRRGAQGQTDQGERLSERSEFELDPGWTEYRRLPSAASAKEGRRQQGRLFFGDFLLAKQKKVTCRRATPGQPAHAHLKARKDQRWIPDQVRDDKRRAWPPVCPPVGLGRGAQQKMDQGERLSERSELELDPIFCEHRRLPLSGSEGDPDHRVAFLLLTFLWRDKEK
jgi:hypothetical protein